MQEWYLHCIKNPKQNRTYFFGTLSGGASDDCLLFESESVGIADVSESGFASGLPGRTKIFCKKSSTNNKESTGIYDSRSSQPLYFAGAIRKIWNSSYLNEGLLQGRLWVFYLCLYEILSYAGCYDLASGYFWQHNRNCG